MCCCFVVLFVWLFGGMFGCWVCYWSFLFSCCLAHFLFCLPLIVAWSVDWFCVPLFACCCLFCGGFLGCLVGCWLFDRLLVVWWVVWLLVCLFLVWLFGCLVVWFVFCCLGGCLVGWLVDCLFGCMLLGCLVVCCLVVR